ncbi:unnamed protein product [Moneuplotes crassus]|uniref:Uncharacterized protein n=3 Tax=Euplotes crassus TaxID=5936 RepID=A0AAD2DC41_EUPCR|nr:unnamed protein product [Moneuplotes crassus]
MVENSEAFSFKQKLHELKQKVVSTSSKVAEEVKKDTKKVIEKVGTAFERFKEKIQDKFRKRVHKQIEEIKEIQNQNGTLTEEQKQKLEKSLKKTFDQVVGSHFILPSQTEKIKEQMPEILANVTRKIDEKSQNWAWRKENEGKFAEFLIKYPHISKEYDEMVKKVMQMVEDKASISEIEAELQRRSKKIFDQIPDNEETEKFFAEFEKRADQLGNSAKFNLTEFRAEVKDFIKKYGSGYKNATDEQKEELINYVIATNEKFDKLLKRIEDKKIVERIIKRFQKKINERLKNNEDVDYDNMMNELDHEIEDVEEMQLASKYDSSIALETPYPLDPLQQFTFTVEDVMVERRADVDFFEFVKVDLKQGLYCEDEDDYEDGDDDDCYRPKGEEGKIVPSGDTIYGVAPSRESLFEYDVQLKYTSFRAGGESTIYNTTLFLRVGDEDDDSPKTVIFFIIIGLSLTTVLILAAFCYRRWSARRVMKYEDFDGDVQIGRKSVDRPPSDLENTASDSN